MAEEIETVVIGGGQAGLALSYYLSQQGRPHVVLEQATQIARPGGMGDGTPSPRDRRRCGCHPYRATIRMGPAPADVVRHLSSMQPSAPAALRVRSRPVDPA
jgi:choline dehydrogenase-like flavoprotein